MKYFSKARHTSSIAGISNRISRAFFLLALLALLSSCSKAFRFNSSTIVPAASGKVSVREDRNNNYSIKVRVNNLADPQAIRQGGGLYILWMDTDSGIKNLGQLQSSKKLFSRARKASLSTVSPFTPRQFFITAEDNANIQAPGYRHVLETDRIQ